jgi:uncharacterized protein (DUF1810 family)
VVATDPYDLARFVLAQNQDGIYDAAVAELLAGRKSGHWMWFVFPQITGLGHSAMSRRYAIASLAEAQAYLGHPLLGPRLIECARILTELPGSSAPTVFGAVDAQKLQSSMTLFHRADPDQPEFPAVLDKYFAGEPDPATERRL